jgi:acyl-CoA thioesterase FadM
VTRTRVDHVYEIHRDGLLTCEASTTLACVDGTGRPSIMPEELWLRA